LYNRIQSEVQLKYAEFCLPNNEHTPNSDSLRYYEFCIQWVLLKFLSLLIWLWLLQFFPQFPRYLNGRQQRWGSNFSLFQGLQLNWHLFSDFADFHGRFNTIRLYYFLYYFLGPVKKVYSKFWRISGYLKKQAWMGSTQESKRIIHANLTYIRSNFIHYYFSKWKLTNHLSYLSH
jgi:hypothetical protein